MIGRYNLKKTLVTLPYYFICFDYSTGSGTDEGNDTKSGALSISTTDGSLSCTKGEDLNGSGGESGSINSSGKYMNEQNSFELCQQVSQLKVLFYNATNALF